MDVYHQIGESVKKETNQKRKQMLCELVADELYVPMKEKELAILLQVKPEDREELKQILEELLAEGKLQITKRGKYIKPDENSKTVHAPGLIQGTFISHPKIGRAHV